MSNRNVEHGTVGSYNDDQRKYGPADYHEHYEHFLLLKGGGV